MRMLAVIFVLLILIPSTQAYDDIPTVTAKWVYQCETDPLTDKKTCSTITDLYEEVSIFDTFEIIYFINRKGKKEVSFVISALYRAKIGYVRIDGGQPKTYSCNNSDDNNEYCQIAVGDAVLDFTNSLLKAKKIYVQVDTNKEKKYRAYFTPGNLKEVKMPF